MARCRRYDPAVFLLLGLRSVLRERLSACGDRSYPTKNPRRVSEIFGVCCGAPVDSDFTIQSFALGCGCNSQIIPNLLRRIKYYTWSACARIRENPVRLASALK